MLKKWRGQNHQEADSLDHDAKVKELRTALGPQSGRSLKYCSDACLRRYLEARNWNVDKAKKMLEETLEWRSTYKPEDIRWVKCPKTVTLFKEDNEEPEVEDEGVTGKVSRANFVDREGRVVLVMRPGKQNTKSGEGSVRHLVYLVENAILNLPENQGQMSWLIDFSGWSLSVTNIQIKTVREIIYVLQNHYPERLAVIVLYDPPRIFQAFFQIVKYFVDPKTYLKIKFVYPNDKASTDLMKSYFDTENLPSEFGGKATLVYDHEEFSRLMAEDDVKSAKFWQIDSQDTNESSEMEQTLAS